MDSVRENPNATLDFDIETVTMDLSIGEDSILLGQELIPTHTHATKMNKSFSPPGWDTYIILKRETTQEDLKAVNMKLMPGFRLSWSFTGIMEEENLKIYSEEGGDYESRTTENFVRDIFRNICKSTLNIFFMEFSALTPNYFSNVFKVFQHCQIIIGNC